MSRPSKAIGNTSGHRTNAEKAQREAAEKAAMTGIAIRERDEVKKNKSAHKEFVRIVELLKAVGKNDALIETVINRYCLLLAECSDFEAKREKIYDTAARLKNMLDEMDSEATYKEVRESAKAISDMYKTAIACDNAIQRKRTMLFNVEKENGFTLAAALRSIPKKVEKENSLAKALRDDD